MQDPFADKSNSKFHREVQMWMAVLVCLLVAFLYLAIKRMSGPQEEFPAHAFQANASDNEPFDYEAAKTVPSRSPQLSNVPPIRSGSFSTNSASAPKLKQLTNQGPLVTAKSDPTVSVQRESSNQFSSVLPRPTAAGLDNDNVLLPQPVIIETKSVDVTTADAKAEAVGRQRAKQLAALTSGLPARLNQIQSSVKRATAELPTEAVASDDMPPAIADNQFVLTSPLKRSIGSPLKPIVEPPKQFVGEQSAKAVKPILDQPAIKNTFASQSLVASPALAPNPDPVVARIPKPSVEASRDSNAFAPLPSLRPNTIPVASKATVEDSKLPLPVEPVGKSSKIVKPNEPVKLILPSSPGQKQHVVRAGESFFTIAQQHYGDGQWFRSLRLANQSVAGGELPVGVSLTIPTTAELTRQFPEYAVRTAAEQPTEAQQRIYVTQTGDTLFDIARRKTGQGSRFSEIMGSNQLRLPEQIRASDQLPEGLRLVLPESSLQ